MRSRPSKTHFVVYLQLLNATEKISTTQQIILYDPFLHHVLVLRVCIYKCHRPGVWILIISFSSNNIFLGKKLVCYVEATCSFNLYL